MRYGNRTYGAPPAPAHQIEALSEIGEDMVGIGGQTVLRIHCRCRAAHQYSVW